MSKVSCPIRSEGLYPPMERSRSVVNSPDLVEARDAIRVSPASSHQTTEGTTAEPPTSRSVSRWSGSSQSSAPTGANWKNGEAARTTELREVRAHGSQGGCRPRAGNPASVIGGSSPSPMTTTAMSRTDCARTDLTHRSM